MSFVAICTLRVKHIKDFLNHEICCVCICVRERREREKNIIKYLSRFAIISLRERESERESGCFTLVVSRTQFKRTGHR